MLKLALYLPWEPLPDTLPLYFSTDRVQKLKDARSEAAKEIEAYKVQKQKDYEAYEAEVNTCSRLCTHLLEYTCMTAKHRSLPSAQEPDVDQPAFHR